MRRPAAPTPGRASVLDQFEVVVDHPTGCSCPACLPFDPDMPRSPRMVNLESMEDREDSVDVVRVGSLLVLRAGQSHENAVEQLSKLFPSEHPDDLTRLVRDAMPNAPSLNNLSHELGVASPGWVRGGPATPRAPLMSPIRTRIIAGAAGAALIGAAFGGYAILNQVHETPFDHRDFVMAASAARFDCTLETDTVAMCRNLVTGTDWKVTATDGLEGDPTTFRFWHGQDIAILWLFDTEEQRIGFPQMAAYKRLYPFITADDRFIVAATSELVMRNLAGAADATLMNPGSSVPQMAPSPTPTPKPWLVVPPTAIPTPTATHTPTRQERVQEVLTAREGLAVPDRGSRGRTEAPRAAGEGDQGQDEQGSAPRAAVTGTPAPSGQNDQGQNDQGQNESQPQTRPTRSSTARPSMSPSVLQGLSVTIKLPVITFGS